MPGKHVSYRSEFGIALHEDGLNLISAGLRETKPDLFAFKTEIEIVPESHTDPGHKLTMYAIPDEPLAFNLYPVPGFPAYTTDTFFISANILFTLEDSILGPITRLRLTIEAGGQIVNNPTGLFLKLLQKSDGSPWIDFLNIQGEHPDSHIRLHNGLIDSGFALTTTLLQKDDSSTANSFRAIMDYLITLFLKDGLSRAVTEFPIPDLKNLIEFGPLGHISGRSIYIRNDYLYLTLGNVLEGEGPFPQESEQTHIKIGASERGLRRIVDALMPIPVPLQIGHGATTMEVTSNNFRIRTIHLDLRPGHKKILGFVFFGGTLYFRLRVKAFGRYIDTPKLPLPIDDSFSHYGGLIEPFIQSDTSNENEGKIQLRMQPDQKFVEAWYGFIATDYRRLFEKKFEEAIAGIKDKLKLRKFCKIPFIGWLVCEIIDISAKISAWATGIVLDTFMSSWLTIIINTIGRATLQLLQDSDFRVFEIEQSTVFEKTGRHIGTASVEQINDSREGELQLKLDFSEGSLPGPAVPVPSPEIGEPEPVPPIQLPTPIELPEYGEDDFEPLIIIPIPTLTSNAVEHYILSGVQGENTISGTIELNYILDDENWLITKETTFETESADSERFFNGHGNSLLQAKYTKDGVRPLECTYENTLQSKEDKEPFTAYHSINLARPGQSVISCSTPTNESIEKVISVYSTDNMDFEELWFFKLAYCDLTESLSGIFSRIETSDPTVYLNWARQIPVNIEVTEGHMAWPPDSDSAAPIWIINSIDEEGYGEIKVNKRGGVLEAKIKKNDLAMHLQRIVGE